MKAYHSENLKRDLGKIVESVVTHFKTDFDKDIEYLSSADEGQMFVWIARKHGTCLMNASDVWFGNVLGNAQCHVYLEDKEPRVFFIELGKKENGLSGNIYSLNREEFLRDVQMHTVAIKYVIANSDKEEDSYISYYEYRRNPSHYHKEWEKIHGKNYGVRYEPNEADAWKLEKMVEKYKREIRNASFLPVLKS